MSIFIKPTQGIWENNVLFADQNLTYPEVKGLIPQVSHSPNFGPIYWA